MKRQLDRLKGKRLVTGDPNLMTKDEICINATPSGVEVKEIGTDGKIKDLAGSGGNGGGGSSASAQFEYYKVKENVHLDNVLGEVIVGDMWALRDDTNGEIWETKVHKESSNSNNNYVRYNDVLKFLKTYSSNTVNYSRDGYLEIVNYRDLFLNNGADYSFKAIVELAGTHNFDDYFESITDVKEIKAIEASITHKDPIVQILEGGH